MIFHIENIKKLFTYNWPELIKSIFPNGNKGVVSEEDSKYIQDGAITRIIAVIFIRVAGIGYAFYYVLHRYVGISSSNYINGIISRTLSSNLEKWLTAIVVAAIIPIAILIINKVNKGKEKNSWTFFVILILSLYEIISLLFQAKTWIFLLISYGFFAVIALIGLAIDFFGTVSVAVGCINFCKQNGNKPVQPVQPVQPVEMPIVESQNNFKFCSKCGAQILSTAVFCPHCGNKN